LIAGAGSSISGITSDLLSPLGGLTNLPSEVVTGIFAEMATWLNELIGGLLQHILDTSSSAAQVTGSSFGQLYAAMFLPAMVLSVFVLSIGVTVAAIQGRAGEIAKRAALAPIAVVVIIGVAAALANDALHLVGWLDSTYMDTALGSGGLGQALAHVDTGTTSFSVPGVADASAGTFLQVVLFFFLLLATLAVYIEMQVRILVIWLMVAIVPLGAAGLFWSGTQRWMRRVAETLLAAILTPFPITVILSVGIKMGMGLGSLSKSLITLVAMGLAAFSLPMMTKLIPIAELAMVSGFGAEVAGRVRAHSSHAGRSAATGALSEGGPAAQRLSGQVQSMGAGRAAIASAGTAGGALAVAATSKAIGFAKQRLKGSAANASSEKDPTSDPNNPRGVALERRLVGAGAGGSPDRGERSGPAMPHPDGSDTTLATGTRNAPRPPDSHAPEATNRHPGQSPAGATGPPADPRGHVVRDRLPLETPEPPDRPIEGRGPS
jgi:hypothetical protein